MRRLCYASRWRKGTGSPGGPKKKLLFDVFCALGHGCKPGPQEVPHQRETGRLEPRNVNIQYFGRRPDDELSQQEREEPKNQ